MLPEVAWLQSDTPAFLHRLDFGKPLVCGLTGGRVEGLAAGLGGRGNS